jgi:hypothetical protein
MKAINTILFVLCFATLSYGQTEPEKPKYIQFSGIVVTEGLNGDPQPLPYTNISIFGTSRGTVAEYDGFFSIVAEVGDTMVFSRIGYNTVMHMIQDTLTSDYYSWYQVMSNDNILLPEAVIYPWPSKDHYKIEFLALDVSNDMRRRMEENLAEQVLKEMRYELPADGSEAYNYVLREQIETARYSGQYKPQNIFNPMAWAEFVKAWKRGDFKKQE